ncbi:thiamine biosynthesis protein ThiS [Gordonia bronchialis DSM 43247]|uniref:Thiamine biosynthesis protein ThiS n=1 Tax=Gordonia bronchialis (strain ATCC 25592 / DSM 43247 / BCRC 13721 / JCM 3198 / KCTC 3076 / NBRC 16047 / NCTC 10667) TaxID=526226 RepID=D0L643_GORB4|nr:sulfur carrier protein ThiS [Gordonia bronchialis]ACY23529.1 thiamine biosynthesis protein ThiS [Gordonia bronchialis DSM 43247]MCC3321694.1 sulfur carrier protein ThiS [Gordonia bronchialis]QGS26799.1 sulfur carrier protein ThiS [Gordonia bronchialis]UAK40619.1 sulfur carrier protein ThiS [Gordonia bronchialis]STQ66531.1 sulfur carrier protein ThiS [Gordonia bronchialis]
MTITLNGEPTALSPAESVAGLLRRLGLPDRGVAVAVDGAVVPKGAWAQPIPDGASVEVVTAVQGG